jgi:hypothetical protein
MASIPPLTAAVAEEAARRYLAAFQQLVTLTSAGPLVVIGIYQITSGDSCGICQLISGNAQPISESLSNPQSLYFVIVALVIFIGSLVLAVWGLLRVAQQGVFGGALNQNFFWWLSFLFGCSTGLFLVGIVISSALLVFSG